MNSALENVLFWMASLGSIFCVFFSPWTGSISASLSIFWDVTHSSLSAPLRPSRKGMKAVQILVLGYMNNLNNHVNSYLNKQEQLNQVSQNKAHRKRKAKLCPGSTWKSGHERTPYAFLLCVDTGNSSSLSWYKVAIALSFIRVQGTHEKHWPGTHYSATLIKETYLYS